MGKRNNLFMGLGGFIIGSLLFSTATFVFAHGGNSNNIHACVKNSNGSIRIIGPSDTCTGSETALDWNALGAPGLGGLIDDLVGADFSNSDFKYKSLAGRNLTDAVFSNAQLVHADVTGANLTNTNFSVAQMTGIVGLKTATLINTNFDNAFMDDIDLSSKDLTNVILINASMTESNFSNSNLSGLDLTNTEFQDSTLTNANFSNALFSGSNLEGATATGANFTGATWINTICIDGTLSNNNGDTCLGHL